MTGGDRKGHRTFASERSDGFARARSNDALLKVRAYRHDQEDDVLPGPADELEIARWRRSRPTQASSSKPKIVSNRLMTLSVAWNAPSMGV
jgi:hypothetical protein